VRLDPSGWFRAQGVGGHGLLIRTLAAMPLQAKLYEGEVTPKRGWCSSDYGLRQPAPVLCYSVTTSLPLRIVTLLVPAATPSEIPPVVSPIMTSAPDSKSALGGLVLGHGKECILIGEEDIVFQRG